MRGLYYRAARVVALLHLVDEATVMLLRIHPICAPAAPSSVPLPLTSKQGSGAMPFQVCVNSMGRWRVDAGLHGNVGGSGCGAFSSPGKVQRHWVDARIPISD